MTIFGVDYIVTNDGPLIVDINDFPSFRSIPEGISFISEHIYTLINMVDQSYITKLKAKVK